MSQPARNTTQHSAAAEDTNQATTGGEPRYFNQYASGIGYLNDVREIAVKGKPVRYGVQIAVIQGPEDDVHYVYHDLTIASEVVLGVVMEHSEAIKSEDDKVIVRFKMANPRPKPFLYKRGKHAGKLGATIGGFLTRILSLKINGSLVYEDTRTFDDQDNTGQNADG